MATKLQALRHALDLSTQQLAALAGVKPSVIAELEQSSDVAWRVNEVQREKVFAALGNKTRQSFPLHKKQELLADSAADQHHAAYWSKKHDAADYSLKYRSW